LPQGGDGSYLFHSHGHGGGNEICIGLGNEIEEEVDDAMDIALESTYMEDGGMEDGNIPTDQQKTRCLPKNRRISSRKKSKSVSSKYSSPPALPDISLNPSTITLRMSTMDQS